MNSAKLPLTLEFHIKIIFLSKYTQCLKFKRHMTVFARMNFNLENLYQTKVDFYKELAWNKKKSYYECINFHFERKKFESKSNYEASIGFVLDQILLGIDKSIHYFIRSRPILNSVIQPAHYFTSKKSHKESDKALFRSIESVIKKSSKKSSSFSKKLKADPVNITSQINKRKSNRVKNKIMRLGCD